MSPPPEFALFLLGVWVLATFAVTNQTGYDQWRAARSDDAAETVDDADGADAR
ncbi:hypothetical protein [Halosolutus gelatinilyticus]|uniref:hypothetical protein n=1 Tax=Halosolutus gelatinilyticus TaxID=2931975 RepID=UPI001FF2895C|nr:hypothetical protein [Halosolutus gelatinilyticus]